MKICLKCGAQLPDNAHFCEKCGAQLDGEITCPQCGKKIPLGSQFCMYCGASTKELGTPLPPPKKNRTLLWVLLALLFVVLVAGSYIGSKMYFQNQMDKAEALRDSLELAKQDSLDQAEFLAKQQEDSLKAIDANHRIELLQVLVGTIYNCRKSEHPNDVVRYYSMDLKAAYNSWNNPNLDGPQGFLYEKRWENSCNTTMQIRNYQTEFEEASSPTENTATFKVKVTFSVYDTSTVEEPLIKQVTHEDEFQLVNEGGNWRVDDFIRDGISAKSRYSNSSSDFGREICNPQVSTDGAL